MTFPDAVPIIRIDTPIIRPPDKMPEFIIVRIEITPMTGEQTLTVYGGKPADPPYEILAERVLVESRIRADEPIPYIPTDVGPCNGAGSGCTKQAGHFGPCE